MILIGLFYYGNEILVTPSLRESAEQITETYETQRTLIEEYLPSEELLSDYEEQYAEAEVFIPLNAQANQALMNLETLASRAKVSVLSLSRVSEQEVLEDSANFAKDTYTAQLMAKSPKDLRQLIESLMEQARIWNVPTFSYIKSGDENYTDSLNFDLYYRIESIE